MNRKSFSEYTLVLMMAASLPVWAQQGGSLADTARQARTQKQAQAAPEDNRAQQVADELSEDQNDGGAPGGFKTYNADDYKLWVPAPFRVEGHDDAGAVLSGPMFGSKQPLVLVGTPIVSHFENSDDAFQTAATQFARVYADTATCTKITVSKYGAYQCTLAAANLLGKRVSGNAVFVQSAGYIYPIMCVTPTDSHARDILNDPHASSHEKVWAREALAHEVDDTRNVWHKCESVFQSIQIKKSVDAQSASADSKKPAVETAPSAAASATAVAQAQAPPTEAAPQSTVPAGFKVQAFNYCKTRTQCWDASVLVPSDAQLVSSDCKQFIFEVKVQGSPFLLLAGPGGDTCGNRSASDPNRVRWNQLAAPETARAPGSSSTIGSLQATLDGKPAIITTIGFRKGLSDWMGKRAEVENNGAQLVVGCMAPREHFTDGDAICSSLIASLRLP